MEEEKKGVKVEIFGGEYFIKGGESPDYIKQVANYVDSKIGEVSKNMKMVSSNKATVLAALNIGDEYFKLKAKKSNKKSTLKKKTDEIYKLVCSELNKLT